MINNELTPVEAAALHTSRTHLCVFHTNLSVIINTIRYKLKLTIIIRTKYIVSVHIISVHLFI